MYAHAQSNVKYTIEVPEYVWYGANECANECAPSNKILKKYFRKWRKLNMTCKNDILSPPKYGSPTSPNTNDCFIVSPNQAVKHLFILTQKEIELKLIEVLNYIQQFIIVYINDPHNKNKPFTHEIMVDMLRHCKLFNNNLKLLLVYNYSDIYWINYIKITHANMLLIC
jgi:hypothetical protein